MPRRRKPGGDQLFQFTDDAPVIVCHSALAALIGILHRMQMPILIIFVISVTLIIIDVQRSAASLLQAASEIAALRQQEYCDRGLAEFAALTANIKAAAAVLPGVGQGAAQDLRERVDAWLIRVAWRRDAFAEQRRCHSMQEPRNFTIYWQNNPALRQPWPNWFVRREL